jgi:type IV pilus assembly protein PilN
VSEFEKRRTQLQQRVALIEELRKGQSGPVHLLDELSRALPDRLWLTQMKQQDGEIRVDGRTTSLTALSDFVGNLESSGYFARPVEILDSQVESQGQQQAAGAGDLVKFTVKAQFSMPGTAPAGVASPSDGAPAAPAAATAAARP